jgi:hypothetical protein
VDFPRNVKILIFFRPKVKSIVHCHHYSPNIVCTLLASLYKYSIISSISRAKDKREILISFTFNRFKQFLVQHSTWFVLGYCTKARFRRRTFHVPNLIVLDATLERYTERQ